MLEVVRGVPIAPRGTLDQPLLPKNGPDVSAELGGRYLLRYVLPYQVGWFTNGSLRPHWVTPTPYAPEDTVSYLYLPNPMQQRVFVMLLNPSRIDRPIQGPRWIDLGQGIEYLLPQGFPGEAVVSRWELGVR